MVQYIGYLFILFTAGLLLMLVRYLCKHKKQSQRESQREGFANLQEKEKPNPILTLLGTLKRISKPLLDRELWKEKLEMAFLSPTDLARRYIRANLPNKQ